MCVIISRPADHKLTLKTLQVCQADNRDGWGIMHAREGRVFVDRGMTWDEFMVAYQAIPEQTPCVIHFRWKTHGLIDLANTHPYVVLGIDQGDAKDLWVMHNGIINTKETHPAMSDTWHWVRDTIRPSLAANPYLLDEQHSISMLEKDIGWSRIVFLDGDGELTYLNPRSWTYLEGAFFSNDNHVRYARQVAYAGGEEFPWDNEAGYVRKSNGRRISSYRSLNGGDVLETGSLDEEDANDVDLMLENEGETEVLSEALEECLSQGHVSISDLGKMSNEDIEYLVEHEIYMVIELLHDMRGLVK